MDKLDSGKPYELGERTKQFAQDVGVYMSALPRTITNIEYGKQGVRSSGSVGANYIEANEALSKKDFVMRIKICRKEAKETRYWLELTSPHAPQLQQREGLMREATELIKIFSSILEKSSTFR